MLQKLKNSIKSKFSSTVFGTANEGFNYSMSRNRPLVMVQAVVMAVISMLLTGFFLLLINNIGGSCYRVSLINCFLMWIDKGILVSIPVFFVIEVMIFKTVMVFSVNYIHDAEKNYDISTKGTYDTAKFMSEEEIFKNFVVEPIETMKAPIFGKDPYNTNFLVGQKHPVLKINRNVLMVAGPSAGKSATFVVPLLLQIIRKGESAIISDPKSELFKIVSELAKILGYEVRIMNLNPRYLANSDPCNFMMYVGEDVNKAQTMSNAIIANTTGGSAMMDFWTEGALNLLQALILRVNVNMRDKAMNIPEKDKNLPYLFTYLTQNELEDIEADFDRLPNTHPAKAPFTIFKDGDDKVKKQVLQGLRIKLKLFNSPQLRKILSETIGGIDFINPGRKKCLYFIGSNDQDSSMSPIVSLCYTLFYQELVEYADKRVDGELPITVHIVLDEYANMGNIPDFEKKLSTVRSRNIVTYIIIQDINQLKTKHPFDAWRTVINDCDYFMMLKTNDEETINWWVTMAGEQTVTVTNKRYDKKKTDVLGIHVQETITEGEGKRNVLTFADARKLKDDEVLLLMSQRDICKLKTFFWMEDHPYGKYIKKHKDTMYVLPVQHYPFWRLIEDGIVTEDFDYDNEPSYILELTLDEKLVIDENYDPDAMLGLKKFKKKKEKIYKPVFLSSAESFCKDKKEQVIEKQAQIRSDVTCKIKEFLPRKTNENDIHEEESNKVPVVRVIKKQEQEKNVASKPQEEETPLIKSEKTEVHNNHTSKRESKKLLEIIGDEENIQVIRKKEKKKEEEPIPMAVGMFYQDGDIGTDLNEEDDELDFDAEDL